MARVYVVSYDLRKSKDYARIESALAAYQYRARFLMSEWFIHTDETAPQIVARLRPSIDADDGLVVTEATRDMHWHGAMLDDVTMGKWRAAARQC
jgi:hypothetical protein